MSIRHLWLDIGVPVWQNGGQVVVIGAAAYYWRFARHAGATVVANDRRIAELDRDLRRWMSDRDRLLMNEMRLISAYASNPNLEGSFVETLVALRPPVPENVKDLPEGSQYHSGSHLRWLARAKEQVLHEYRDEATRALDELDNIVDSEGRLHRLVRRRRALTDPSLRLRPESLALLAHWREDVIVADVGSVPVNDLSRADLEPGLARLELSG